jgi:NAD(P)-dependent dehydrogenase (short-subunit alcohol dehydrogenase family)
MNLIQVRIIAIIQKGNQKVMRLEKKVALITGGNSGIGLATAKQFVNEGAYVFITGRREPELAAAVKEIGRNVTGIPGDVSNLNDLDRLFSQIKREILECAGPSSQLSMFAQTNAQRLL